jgi:tetratricopeptide (TPR) repeat protein
MRRGAAPVSVGLGLVCIALALSRVPLASGSDDKKLPKQPDHPFSVAVTASPRPTPSTEAETKAAKDVSDSIADLQEHIRNKRKDWFALVTDPAEAEILLEIESRGREAGHGAVLRGRVLVLDIEPSTILGQGALNPNSLNFKDWREAAGDMAGRLQVYCQKSYDRFSAARKRGARPLAVIANDRGVSLLKAGRKEEAKQAFSEAIRLSPGSPVAFFNRGLVNSILLDYETAIADFDAVLRLDPSHAKAHLQRGIAHREHGDLEAARADLTEAIRTNPKDADALVARARTVKRMGDTKAALVDFDEAIRLDTRPDTLLERAILLTSMGEADRALADYDAILKMGPGSAAVHYNRGRLLAAKGDPRACGAFETAVTRDKSDPDSLFERGLCSAKRGELDKAIADFGECVRLKPTMAVAYFNRGLCYGKQNKVKLASADRAQALKLDPSLAKPK